MLERKPRTKTRRVKRPRPGTDSIGPGRVQKFKMAKKVAKKVAPSKRAAKKAKR